MFSSLSRMDYIGRHEAPATLTDKLHNGLYIASCATKWALGASLLLVMSGNMVYEPAPPRVGGAQLSPEQQAREAVGSNRFASCEVLGVQALQAARYPGDLTKAALAVRTHTTPDAEKHMANGAGSKQVQLEWSEPDFVAREVITGQDGTPEVVKDGSTRFLDATSQPGVYEGFLPAGDDTDRQAPNTLGVFVAYSASTIENGVQTTTKSEQYCGSIGRDAASSWQVVPSQQIPLYTREFTGGYASHGDR